MPTDQKCQICLKRKAYVRPELRGRALCDDCAERVKDVSVAAASLSRSLMEWGKQEEWAGVPISVMLEAMDEAVNDFSEHVVSGRPLAEGPRLLAVEVVDSELVLTLGTNATQVWRETYGGWDSTNPRSIFLRVISSAKRLGDLMTIYYWDREQDGYAERTCWSVDENLQGEFNEAVYQVPGGVPRFTFSVDGLPEGRLEPVRSHLFELVRSIGLYPGSMRIDKKLGTVSCEATGNLTERRRVWIAQIAGEAGIVGVDDLVISEGRPGRT